MIPINKPWLGGEEKEEVLRVLEENALTSPAKDGGRRVREFESLARDYLNVKHVIAVNSGTAALQAALMAAEVGQGDEVLLPSFTFVATANAVVATGARPVFVDVKKDDFTLDHSDIHAKLTKRTKAIIPVHLYGHPCDMHEISDMAQRHSISVIEDACQSLGSVYEGKQTGTLGSMGCFSLYASKVLTSGEGGAIATNDDRLADNLKMIRNHGMVEGYDTRILGLNLRLPEICAAIAKAQMKKLARMLELRRKNASLLTEFLKTGGYATIPTETRQKKYNWYLYTVSLSRDRDRVKEKLNAEKIGATVYYNPPVHRTPYYKLHFPHELPQTDWCADHVLSLPVHPLLSEQDIQNVATAMKSAVAGLGRPRPQSLA
jgi:dTDP-4-amino-4,6-dideoxygalactose transaminase